MAQHPGPEEALTAGSLACTAGQIKRLFSPYHVDLEASSLAEISPQIVSDLLNNVTMRGSRVTDAKPATAATGAARAYTAPAEAPKTGTGADNVRAAAGAAVTFENEAQLQGDIADVRNDNTPTNWCLYGYKVRELPTPLFLLPGWLLVLAAASCG